MPGICPVHPDVVGMSPKQIDRQPPIAPRPTHYERVQWFTARHGCREMPLATALLAMTGRGRIVRCGDRLGTRPYQRGNAYGPLVGASIERLIDR